ncbi:MAG: NAD(P)-dependent oxidoreductase [Acetatifactor sp.]|nr:NAD(P)-dependent oxidoreductase [Acetatifactor sp.]
MNVLLIGGPGSLADNLIIKLNKEGHRIYLLTGDRFGKAPYQKVFERYNFTYDNSCLNEIFESVHPDLTIFLGAYDTNFRWNNEETASVKFSSSLMNLLMAYAMLAHGRFVFLSSDAVYEQHYPEDISEDTETTPNGLRGMALAQAEEMCESYRRNRGLDIITLRLDHLYSIPSARKDVTDICSEMCLQAFEKKKITYQEDTSFSLLFLNDAVEFIYRVVACKEHKHSLYNISASAEITQKQLAEIIQEAMGEGVEIIGEKSEAGERRIVLSNLLFDTEFGNPFFCNVKDVVTKISDQMKRNSYAFLTGEDAKLPLMQRIIKKIGWFLKAVAPFVENLLAFIPFFMLNNRAVGSAYFANLDFYLLYVLLFAIVYGQQQATFSAVLAVIGYSFRQMYDRSGFDLLLDANTYVWIAQLFILGLVVGYMRDSIGKLREENVEEKEFLAQQLGDIQDINTSNVRVKDALETQIVNQNDSVGKIYSITSALDQYSPEEVLFYAAEVLGTLVKSKDVAIYTVSNRAYARLFSSTSKKARMLGNSIQYTQMGEMYETLSQRRVFINRKMDDKYPLMANALFDDKDEMQMIMMIWGIPWESMTLGQANQLVIISALIQNAVLRSNRYLAVLESQRYVENSSMLETEAFSRLMQAYLKAQDKGLTECTVLKIEADQATYLEAGKLLAGKLRQTDYIGTLEDGGLYTLLPNTAREDAHYVINRFADIGYNSIVMEEM